MPAKFIKTYKYTAPDGTQFDTLRAEQEHELNVLIPAATDAAAVIAFMLDNPADIIAILKQRERKNASPAKMRKPRKATPLESKDS